MHTSTRQAPRVSAPVTAAEVTDRFLAEQVSFNNLCETGWPLGYQAFQEAVVAREEAADAARDAANPGRSGRDINTGAEADEAEKRLREVLVSNLPMREVFDALMEYQSHHSSVLEDVAYQIGIEVGRRVAARGER